ncbi:MAG: hypothetical protein JW994_05515 [Candidatus Omnitrophica bacterium]|nr:hypothetical protein [Candidatus Omnitrophota bacterium]
MSMLEDIKNIKSTRKELREFGLTIGIFLVILGILAVWRGKAVYPYFLATGILFISLGLWAPPLLKPLQKIWMGFSIVIGFFVSRFILIVLFYTVITPMGLITRLMGKDILDQRIDRTRESYWHKRNEIKDKKSYENQY